MAKADERDARIMAKMSALVGAPLYASAYPKHKLGQPDYRAHTHIFELGTNREPVRVLCGSVAFSSYYEDTTQHVMPREVSCRACRRKLISELLSSNSGPAK